MSLIREMLRKAIFGLFRAGRAFVERAFEDCLDNPLSYGLLPIAYRLIFLMFFPSTIDVSIWRSEMSQYFRSKSSLLSINV